MNKKKKNNNQIANKHIMIVKYNGTINDRKTTVYININSWEWLISKEVLC